MKKRSTSLRIREIKIGTTGIRRHTSQNGKNLKRPEISAGNDVKTQEPSYAAGGNASRCSHSGNSTEVPKELKAGLPYNPANALGIYPTGNCSEKGHMLPNARSSHVHQSNWKGPSCPSTDAWARRGPSAQRSITDPSGRRTPAICPDADGTGGDDAVKSVSQRQFPYSLARV